jgi:ubiquinone/menaquinone biosynthesis C-methylase UbiE
MAHKFNLSKKDKLDNSWRRDLLPPAETLLEMGLEYGDDMADIGCGIGYFTTEGAKVVGRESTVYGLDISEEMLEDTRRKAEGEGIENVVLVKTEEYDLRLQAEAVSYALAVNVVHEVDDREKFLNEIRRILKAEGRIAVIDFEKEEMEMGPPLSHRISAEEMQKLLEDLGFRVNSVKKFSDIFYGIIATK